MNKITGKINLLITVFCLFSFSSCSDDDNSTGVQLPVNSKVIMLGDSYFDMDEYITMALEDLSGERYRHYYVSGAEFTDSAYGITSIPQQYDNAKAQDPDIRTVIMDGGGNDVLLGGFSDCADDGSGVPSAECIAIINEAFDSAALLIDEMETDGIENVIYMYYPHLINDMWVLNAAMDYASDIIEAICNDSDMNCYFIDPLTAFEGHPEYIKSDNIHPSRAGGDVLAGLIWDVMVQNNIEQPAE